MDVKTLQHEAEFYGLSGLSKQLLLCSELGASSGCGDVLFYSYLTPPLIPAKDKTQKGPAPARGQQCQASQR